MYTEEHTQMLIQIATLLDLEYEEVKKFIELMLGGYNFEDGVNGCSLTTDECKLILVEIQKRKPKDQAWSVINSDSESNYFASVFINIFAVVSAFYIMTVYDKVVPNSAYSSLIALTVGMVIVHIFDFTMKMLRAYFIDIKALLSSFILNTAYYSLWLN